MRKFPSLTGLILTGWILLLATAFADMKVKTDHDPAFDFTKARTWAWNAKEPGRVITARTANDNPEEIKSRAEPIIMAAVSTEMAKQKTLQSAGSEAPDLTLAYSLLLTLGSQSQQMGQFVPSTMEWGIVPFSGATQSLRGFEQGSLLLDMSANGQIVWRGVAQAEIKPGMPQTNGPSSFARRSARSSPNTRRSQKK